MYWLLMLCIGTLLYYTGKLIILVENKLKNKRNNINKATSLRHESLLIKNKDCPHDNDTENLDLINIEINKSPGDIQKQVNEQSM